MPQTTYSSFTSSSSTSYTPSDGETQTWGHRSARESHRDAEGNTYERSLSQNLGEQPVYEERQYDSQGRQRLEDDSHHDLRNRQGRRIEDVSGEK
ncbi:hypothetical protein PISL3812_06422 [Talaromyces islandicus]|uniref:Uncharacterized protein n=1 Tax=Talaromyces islandicus TaxID=28573 RepID=A0A0U1M2T4_TALIS|nr:hypothetical protein PISL3812_06422 [Talaromyces islandicus]